VGETVAKPGGRWSELRGEDEGTRRLALRLRALADQHGRRLRDLGQVMPYGRTTISDRLSGAARPEWEFVVAFIASCVPHDARAADQLKREIRPLWEAAGRGRAVERAEPTLPELTELAGSMRVVAVAQRQTAEAQLAVTNNIKHLAGLATLLDHLSENVQQLTRERDMLRQELNDRVRQPQAACLTIVNILTKNVSMLTIILPGASRAPGQPSPSAGSTQFAPGAKHASPY